MNLEPINNGTSKKSKYLSTMYDKFFKILDPKNSGSDNFLLKYSDSNNIGSKKLRSRPNIRLSFYLDPNKIGSKKLLSRPDNILNSLTDLDQSGTKIISKSRRKIVFIIHREGGSISLGTKLRTLRIKKRGSLPCRSGAYKLKYCAKKKNISGYKTVL